MNGARVSTGYGCLHTLGMWDEATTRVCVYKKWYLAQPPLASPNLKKNLKISKKSPTNLIVIYYSLKQAKISYANGRVSVRIFYKNNLINPNPFLSQE